jgi:hypothetical protein
MSESKYGKNPPGLAHGEIEIQGPCCAHLSVRHDPRRNDDGSWTSQWLCTMCGHTFSPCTAADLERAKEEARKLARLDEAEKWFARRWSSIVSWRVVAGIEGRGNTYSPSCESDAAYISELESQVREAKERK